jgi:hypothetical protein
LSVPTFRVFSRRGCHLCELLLDELALIVRGRAKIEVVDIDLAPGLSEKYGTRVPVVELGGRVLCEYRLEPRAIEDALENEAPGHRS